MKVGDEVWWFEAVTIELPNRRISPGKLQLVHDIVLAINEDGQTITTDYCKERSISGIWGTSKKQAWDRLKADLEKWGSVE